MRRLVLAIAVAAAALPLRGRTQDAPRPAVLVTAPAAANYPAHLAAVARLGFDADYGLKHQDSVTSDDRRFLESNRRHLHLTPHPSPPLAWLGFVLPIELGLDTAASYERYVTLLADGFEQGDLVPFFEAWPLDWIDPVVAAHRAVFDVQPASLREIRPLVPVLRRLGTLYARNLPRWKERVWAELEPALAQRVEELSADLEKAQAGSRWLALTRQPAPAEPLRLLLTAAADPKAPAYPVSGTSRILASGCPRPVLLQAASHQLGLHVLSGLEQDLRERGEQKPEAVHAVVETVAMFFNRRVLSLEALDYSLPQFGDAARLRLYERAWREGMGASELIELGLRGSTHPVAPGLSEPGPAFGPR